MGQAEWKTVHDASRFAQEVAKAARDGENPDFRLGALARQALEEWNLAGAELAIGHCQGASRDLCNLWTLLARRYLDLGAHSRGLAVLDRAHQTAIALEQHWQRGEALHSVAALLWHTGDKDRARPVWKEAVSAVQGSGTEEAANASSVLAEIAEALAVAGLTEWAHEVAASVPHAPKGERALLRIRAIATSRTEAKA